MRPARITNQGRTKGTIMSKEERRNELSDSNGSRIEGLRDGLRKIVECEQGDVSNGQAIVLMREIAKLTLRADDIRQENK